MSITIPEADENNAWRLQTPGAEGWVRSPRANAEDKFFMLSADGHVQEPTSFLSDRVDSKYLDRLPGVIFMPKKKSEQPESDGESEMYQKTEGFRPTKITTTPLTGTDKVRNSGG